MPEIKLKARLQNKYQTLEEWNQLVKGDFTPLKGEICYGIDEGVLYQKIGDGETDFVDLPWILNQSDWLEGDKTSPNYIQNRIAYVEVAEGDPILEIKYVNNDGISNPMVIQDNVAIACEGREFAEEDIGKLWSFNLKCTNTDGTNPLEIDIPGPVELKTFETDGDIIYYYGNFYRFYIMYAIIELQDEIAAGDITIEDIEQIVRDELQIEDTNENYAFVNMYGTIIGAMFGVTPDDPDNFNYEFSLSSYPTIVHKLDSKYLEEVNLVGKFEDIDDFSEIFNDYANNGADAPYSHAEGRNSKVNGGSSPLNYGGGHAEGYNTKADGNAGHAEGCQTIAIGCGSHAEGYNTSTKGSRYGEHAEGYCTQASGYGAHSEGMNTIANYFVAEGSAHAEGRGSIASGKNAHAEGGNELVANQWNKFTEYSYVDYKIDNATCPILSKNQIDLKNLHYSYRIGIIEVYSDEASFDVYPDGTLCDRVLSDELVASGTLHNVFYRIQREKIGAAGDYSHVEGKNNTAIGDYSHVEGEKNIATGNYSHIEGEENTVAGTNNHVEGSYNMVEGNSNHVGGQNNTVIGQNNFIHGKYLLDDDINGNQFIIGRYNQPDHLAQIIVGGGAESNRKNNLTLDYDGNLQVAGLINDGEENNIWKLIRQKQTGSLVHFFHFYEEDCPIPRSNIIKPNLLKISIQPDGSTILFNGNLLPLNKLQNITLDNGTTITVNNEDFTITVDAKLSAEEQIILLDDTTFYAGRKTSNLYCWDETADSEIYYGLQHGNTYITSPGNHLIAEEDHSLNTLNLNLHIAPNTEKIVVLKFPVLMAGTAPRRWVPPMEHMTISKNTDLELDISKAPYYGQISVYNNNSSNYSYTKAQIYVIPKTLINENRIGMVLDGLKEEISTSLILKSPNGTKFNITVNDDGTLSATQI